MSVEDVSMKALGYGMARDRFFADDVFQVKERLGEAIDRARTLSEPTLVEIRTYRFRGHSMSDPGKYRTPEELEDAQEAGRRAAARARLIAEGFTEALETLEKAGRRGPIADAVRFAEESPEPGPELLEPTTYAGAFAR
jgi:pyruvate dehydrogenase E1 component alpha subunit